MDALDLTLGWLSLLSFAFWLATLVVLTRAFPLDPPRSRAQLRGHALLLAAAAYCLAPGPVTLQDIVLRPWAAVLVSVGSLAVAVFGYRVLCDALRRRPQWLAFLLYGALAYAAWGYHQLFDASGAHLHTGALLIALMASNLHTQAAAGQTPERLALCEPHNRYLAPALLLTLICGHAPGALANPYAWQVLLLFAGLLAVIQYGLENALTPRWLLAPALGMLALYLVMPDGLQREPRASAAEPSLAALLAPSLPAPEPLDTHREFALVQRIIQDRCLECHSRTPSNPLFQTSPLVPTFDTPDQILAWKRAIHDQAVASQNMPLANLTQMSQAERDLLGLWIEKGGNVE